MRYTIRGRDHDLHRAGIRRDRLTRGEAWRIILTADRLHGIGLSKHPRSVHRERVRFGAWEGRPSSAVTYTGEERAVAHMFDARRDDYEDSARHALTLAAPYVGAWDGAVSDQHVTRLARTFAHLDWSAGAR